MTDTSVALISPNVTNELYNITVTCRIHPDSTADQCVVMAVADGSVTRTGSFMIYDVIPALIVCMHAKFSYLY